MLVLVLVLVTASIHSAGLVTGLGVAPVLYPGPSEMLGPIPVLPPSDPGSVKPWRSPVVGRESVDKFV